MVLVRLWVMMEGIALLVAICYVLWRNKQDPTQLSHIVELHLGDDDLQIIPFAWMVLWSECALAIVCPSLQSI